METGHIQVGRTVQHFELLKLAASTDTQVSNWSKTNGKWSITERIRASHHNSLQPRLSYAISQGTHFLVYKNENINYTY